MTIKMIEIKNFKSLENVKISLSNLNCLIGENGVGKTNVLNAIKYFYENLIEENISSKYYDKKNPYKQGLEISITYDLSKILNILRRKDPFSRFYRELRSLNNKHYFDSDFITVKLTQQKNSGLKWNIGYDERYMIYKTHPIYFVSARDIDLINWDSLWGVIGDIGNLSKSKQLNENDFYDDFLEEAQRKKFKKNIEAINKELDNNNIQILKSNGKNRIISLYQLQLGGVKFSYKNESLNYFSDGTNSGNFIKLLSFLVTLLSMIKLKDPTIVIDEPEIGLHPKLIDELVKKIVEESSNVKYLMATHSPRIVKNILREDGAIYRLNFKNNYSRISKMKPLIDKRAKIIVSEKEASFYFARRLLFVEGDTELELFNNKQMNKLFPKLAGVEIVSLGNNEVTLEIINPTNRKLEIPYLIITDADKIIEFKEDGKIKFLSQSYSPINNNELERKELFYYKEKREYFSISRNKINNLADNNAFDIKNNLGELRYKESYEELWKYIKNLCLEYNYYPVKTTIEGTIITTSNKHLFIEWLKNYRDSTAISYFLNRYEDILPVLRIAVGGKLDNLKKKIFYEEKNQSEEECNSFLDKLKLKKTSGWVTEFINFVFETEINISESEYDRRNKFRVYFPELYDIIENIENRMYE